MEAKYDDAMVQQWINEAAVEESTNASLYSHPVQVLTPTDLLEQVDNMTQADKRLSRPIIFRRALRLYLRLLKQSGHPAAKTTRTRKRQT